MLAESQEPIFDLTAMISSLVDSSGLPAVAGLSDGALPTNSFEAFIGFLCVFWRFGPIIACYFHFMTSLP